VSVRAGFEKMSESVRSRSHSHSFMSRGEKILFYGYLADIQL